MYKQFLFQFQAKVGLPKGPTFWIHYHRNPPSSASSSSSPPPREPRPHRRRQEDVFNPTPESDFTTADRRTDPSPRFYRLKNRAHLQRTPQRRQDVQRRRPQPPQFPRQEEVLRRRRQLF